MIETKLREEQNVQHVMFTNCKDPGDKVVKKYVSEIRLVYTMQL